MTENEDLKMTCANTKKARKMHNPSASVFFPFPFPLFPPHWTYANILRGIKHGAFFPEEHVLWITLYCGNALEMGGGESFNPW